MLRAWDLIDFGPDLSRVRRTARVIAETAEDAVRLCPGELVIPFPAEMPASAEPPLPTRSVAWIYAA